MDEKKAPVRGYTYMAYISCVPEDYQYAARLRRDLQAFRIPARTRKKYAGISSRCTPVFLKKAADAKETADRKACQEVQDARNLIVICSRNARKNSQHQDEELKAFLEAGGDRDHIFPFLLEKSKNAVEECFPEYLAELCKEEDIVGANIHDAGWRTAVLKVIASMLGIKRVELEADDQRRRRNRRILAAVLTAAALAAGFFCWDYFRMSAEYYADYTEVNGIPKGIGAIKKSDAGSLPSHYVILKSQRKVREIRYENAYGNLIEPDNDAHFISAASMQYEYTEGELDNILLYNSQGSPLYVMNYKGMSTIDLDKYWEEEDSISQSVYLDAHSTQQAIAKTEPAPKSSIMRCSLFYDDKGYVREIRYSKNTWNAAGSDADGVSGVRFTRDDLGRVVKTEFLSFAGSENGKTDSADDYLVTAKKNGVAGIEFVYEGDQLAEERFVDAQGNGIPCEYGYTGWKREYDPGSGKLTVTLLDAAGAPALHSDGYAGWESKYEENGNKVTTRYFGTAGEPVLLSGGYAGLEKEYDGKAIRVRYYGTDGEPVLHKDGYTGFVKEYDAEGHLVKVSYYDADGEPVLCKDGYAGWESKYGFRENESRRSYFGKDGEPVVIAAGYASVEFEYNDQGECVRERYYDINGKELSK